MLKTNMRLGYTNSSQPQPRNFHKELHTDPTGHIIL